MGLLNVADQYGSTKAGNLALYYAADAYYKLGEHESALQYFRRFDHGDDALGAGAYAGEAAVLESMGNHAEAADTYRQAALVHESDFTSGRYLQSAGRNYEMAGAYDEAREVYEMIRTQFPESAQASEVDMLLARVNLKENQG